MVMEDTMRMPITPLSAAGIFAAAVAAIVCASEPASAQSPYSYPWCARNSGRAYATSCYFATQQQCLTTISGIGGYCAPSPYYHANALAARHWRG
jgi:Protein of unknown function (DUF3551)